MLEGVFLLEGLSLLLALLEQLFVEHDGIQESNICHHHGFASRWPYSSRALSCFPAVHP